MLSRTLCSKTEPRGAAGRRRRAATARAAARTRNSKRKCAPGSCANNTIKYTFGDLSIVYYLERIKPIRMIRIHVVLLLPTPTSYSYSRLPLPCVCSTQYDSRSSLVPPLLPPHAAICRLRPSSHPALSPPPSPPLAILSTPPTSHPALPPTSRLPSQQTLLCAARGGGVTILSKNGARGVAMLGRRAIHTPASRSDPTYAT
jgi:hypothetical protein